MVGDLYLLCSDGLTGMMSDSKIREVVARPLELEEMVDRLIEGAKSSGGSDNITVVLCRILGS